jgi:hypothetical protein
MVLRRVARHSDPQTNPGFGRPARGDGDWARLNRHYDLMVSCGAEESARDRFRTPEQVALGELDAQQL